MVASGLGYDRRSHAALHNLEGYIEAARRSVKEKYCTAT
jgi:hypothetical protein